MARPKTPEISLIRAWIDNSSFLDELNLGQVNDIVSDAINDSDLLQDLQDKLDYYIQESYDEGQDDAEPEDIDEVPNLMQEEIGVNYAVEQFKDCKSLEEFQQAYKEIENRSFNFMR